MQRVIKAAVAALWFMLLTLPVLGLKLNTIERTVTWRLDRIALLGLAIFGLAMLWDWCFSRKARGLPIIKLPAGFGIGPAMAALSQKPKLMAASLAALAAVMIIMPMVSSFYQTNIMISALLYVMLALGLNIVVGLAGQLVLGYVAFYAVGAYAYGLLHQFFGFGFWMCLPIGGFVAVIFGLALGFPVLRLRGDYLAIVTLGFGEIVRLALQNWTSLTGGPRGVSDIPRPGLFGMQMDINTSTTYVYYLVLVAVVITIVVISRLKNSRVGLALQALREDEIACEAMGIDIMRVKLSAFALGSCWAGFAGVIFAAKTTYINPSSFTFMESAMILSMVVLGGMGSITGVAIAAFILILAPEYLRAFSEYRMLIFGAIMVIMMIFRPQGLISGERRRYRISALHDAEGGRP
ncbi:branched-chain amino acid ABC transporter permease [Desulfovibrio sp. 86]|uniref:High-affinity branched-chain amino acid transport system permease protein BraE n=1 Tax=uncultured Desulfovibrio sp. TaxID=167968 RepID=A0A212L040_9BACT|nr:branched-chain amino acid ABC transporter permease [Desulfovibrio sp. 86]SCM70866.1 High-affinity branched-chain amino acid transport system permease protein BraE [uncultured Desulfovibrio sp.]VZH32558.1 High-affinity branched-chain amino acid transport system permease protein BraE [Desulfovibrio sp. 86]